MQTETRDCPRRSGWGILAVVLVGIAAIGAFLVALFVGGALLLGARHYEPEAQVDHRPPVQAPTVFEER